MKIPQDLAQCVEDLTTNAFKSPTDVIQQAIQSKPPDQSHQRIVKIDKLYVKMTFTYNQFGSRMMWQLSLKDNRHEPLPQEIVDLVVHAFFGEGDCFEIPSMLHKGIVKQFAQFVERSNESRNSPTRTPVRGSQQTPAWIRDEIR